MVSLRSLLICLSLLPIQVLGVEVGGIAGGHYSVPVTSFVDRKFETIYRQEYDFSCGSAALASLLSYHYNDRVTEHEIFIDMYSHGDQAKIKQQGFSMLDMKRYLDRRGYKSSGFQVKLDLLNVPAITIIDNKGYLHFVLIKGVTASEVLIGDPSLGVKSIERARFEEMWGNRILFMIADRTDVAVGSFQSEAEWARRVKAPTSSMVDRASIGRELLLKRGNHDL